MRHNFRTSPKDVFMHAGFTPALYLPSIDYSAFESPYKERSDIKAEIRNHMKSKSKFKTIFKQSF